MSAPRKLDPNKLSLEDLVAETLFTKLVVRNTPETKALVADADKLHADAVAALADERKLIESRLEGEVQVALGNRTLDAAVAALRALVNQRTDSKPEHPLYQRFFNNYRPSEVIRMTLATELPIVEPWVKSLKADADAGLVAIGSQLEKQIASGRMALLALGAARQALKDFEAGSRALAFTNAATGRAALYAALRKISSDDGWIESFFRPSYRRSSDEQRELSVSEVQALVDTREKELTAARTELTAAQAREAAALAVATARAAKTAEREAKKKELLALRSRLAELDEELRA